MTRLGTHARRTLGKLAAGGRLARVGEGWRLGGMAVPQSLVDELARHDLVRVVADEVTITTAGAAWADRQRAPEAPNRAMVACPKAEGTSPRVNLAESPLGWLMRRRLISARQFEAGEQLRADFTTASLAPRVTMRWDAGPASRQRRGPAEMLDPTTAQVAAKRRFEAAVAAAGAGLADVLWRVVCVGEGLETAERGMGWPARAGKVVLGLALDRLADHYGLR